MRRKTSELFCQELANSGFIEREERRGGWKRSGEAWTKEEGSRHVEAWTKGSVNGNMAQRKIKGECMQREAEPDRESPWQEQQKEMRGWETALRKTNMYLASKACEAFVVGMVISSGTRT